MPRSLWLPLVLNPSRCCCRSYGCVRGVSHDADVNMMSTPSIENLRIVFHPSMLLPAQDIEIPRTGNKFPAPGKRPARQKRFGTPGRNSACKKYVLWKPRVCNVARDGGACSPFLCVDFHRSQRARAADRRISAIIPHHAHDDSSM